MKSEQIVCYSDKEAKFKTESLLYVDVDGQVRANLFNLFSSLSEYKKYQALSRGGPITFGLIAVFAFVVLIIAFAVIGLTQRPSAGDKLVLPTADSTLNPATDVPSDLPAPTSAGRLLQFSIPRTSNPVSSQPRSSGDEFPKGVGMPLVLCLIALLVTSLLLVAFEYQQRQKITQLRTFELNTINLFLSKRDKNIEIRSEHSKRRILYCFRFFNVYNFQFVVKRLDLGDERTSLNSSQVFERRPGSFTSLDGDHSVNSTRETEGEKYHSAIISLNKKLDRLNIKS